MAELVCVWLCARLRRFWRRRLRRRCCADWTKVVVVVVTANVVADFVFDDVVGVDLANVVGVYLAGLNVVVVAVALAA